MPIVETITSIAATAALAKKAEEGFTATLNRISEFARNGNATSLSKYTKSSLIEAPCFIQDSIAEESCVNDIIKNLYNIYVGYVICAMSMDQYVIDGRRVRDLIAPVSTQGSFESLENLYFDCNFLTQNLIGDMEGISKSFSHTFTDADGNKITETETEHPDSPPKEDKYNSDKNRWGNVAGHGYQPDKNLTVPIAAGRMVNITFNTGPDSPPVTIPLFVKVNNRIIPSPVMEYVFGRDFNVSALQRWLQYRAGELRFVRDFILGIDISDRRARALKADKTNALSEMLRHQSKTRLRQLTQNGSNRSYNLSNAIIIADEETVQDISKKSGYNLDRPMDRNKFFNSIYGLFIVLIDSRYSRVTIYTNGIDQSASYSYNELKSAASSDKMSLKDVMDYLTKSQMPKF